MRNYIQILNFVQVAYKIFSNWSSNPYSSTQHQFFVACSLKSVMQSCSLKFEYIEHTCSHNSWIPFGGVVNSLKRRLKSAQKCSMRFKSRDCASH